jgi:hypothetical protein
MRIYFRVQCWRVIGLASAVATVAVYGETLRVPMPPMPPGAEGFLKGAANDTSTASANALSSPVENFRSWLNMSAEQRAPLLAKMPEAERQALESKLAKYDSLPAEARDLRLRQTQLHWHLLELMKLPPSQRKHRLVEVPTEQRGLVMQRLHQWDALSTAEQKTFLENEAATGLYLQMQETPPHERTRVLIALPQEVRKPMEQQLQKWNGLPAQQRQELTDRFNQFFQLQEREQEKVVKGLPQNVRAHVEKMRDALKHLPLAQRKQCTEALNKFLAMTPDEQNKFLINAARWQRMSETEHDAWREIINKVPAMPPLPPGVLAPPLFAGTNRVVLRNAP